MEIRSRKYPKMEKIAPIFALLSLIALFLFPSRVFCFSERLFFVGEELEILTASSRHPERPSEAPAICEVITREEIERGGYRTLGELLRTAPGLFVAPREADWRPYFRGIPDGFLLLYDGVPFTSDSTKAVYDLGEEISLEALERVEIVRGPSSVLWGPDAFAGLINLVPRRRGPRSLRLLVGSPLGDFSLTGFFPFAAGLWQGALTLSYYGRDVRPAHFSFPGASGSVGRAESYEAVFSLTRGEGLRLTGRLSHSRHPFVMKGPEGFSWPGEKKTPFNFLKLEHKISRGQNTLRTTLYYEYFSRRQEELSVTRRHRNHLFYAELLFDHHFGARNGLLTLGASWRRDLVRDATVSVRGYLPDFLREKNRQFLPLVETADFATDLYSLFFQVRRNFRHFALWAGLRFSDHDHYHSEWNHQLGALLNLPKDFSLKLVYGTSYRTPYAAKFLGRDHLREPEELRSLSLELAFRREGFEAFLSPFLSRVSHHIAEDPFGGYSRPLKHYFLGLEAGFKLKRGRLSLAASLTALNHWGEREVYRVLDYLIILPGTPPKAHYSTYEKPFSAGPKAFADLKLGFRLMRGLSLFGRLSWVDSRSFTWLKTGRRKSLPARTLLDLALRLERKNYTLSLAVKNGLDTGFHTAGRFSPLKSYPFSFYTTFSWHW